MSLRLGILAVSLLLGLDTVAEASALETLTRGDQAFARRAEGHDGPWAGTGPIAEAIAAFEQAVKAEPENHLARKKLLRALFFQGDYVLKDHDEKLRVFERGQVLGEEGIAQLTGGTTLDRRGRKDRSELIAHLRDQPQAAGIYYWAAAHWGLWGRHRGKIAAARQGVAGRIRDYSEIVNEIDSGYDHGGGHRMLGRLHSEAPKIPLVTGWINRKTAISELETAMSYSDDPLTLLYFIDALLDYAPSRRDEAMGLLHRLVTIEPDSDNLVEELRAISDARVLLDSLRD